MSMKVKDEPHASCTDVRFHAYHGVLEQERSVGNDYVVNIRGRLRFHPCPADR